MNENLLIENTTIVTMNPQRDILTNAYIAISGERIAAVGQVDEIRARYPHAERIDGRGKVVLPGLINCHTHISMNLQKGITLAVPDGLYRVMWPVERSLTPDDCYIGALVGGAEALKGGTTCVVDHYFHMEQVRTGHNQTGSAWRSGAHNHESVGAHHRETRVRRGNRLCAPLERPSSSRDSLAGSSRVRYCLA